MPAPTLKISAGLKRILVCVVVARRRYRRGYNVVQCVLDYIPNGSVRGELEHSSAEKRKSDAGTGLEICVVRKIVLLTEALVSGRYAYASVYVEL